MFDVFGCASVSSFPDKVHKLKDRELLIEMYGGISAS